MKALAADKKNSTKKAGRELDALLKQVQKKAFMKGITAAEEAELVRGITELQAVVGS